MSRKIKIILFALCVLYSAQGAFASSEDVETWLSRLDSSLAMRSVYEKEYVRHIDGLKKLMRQSVAQETQYDMCRQIYLAYQSYRADSALVYAEKELALANKLGSKGNVTLAKADIAYAMFFTGEFLDSYFYIKDLSGKELPRDMAEDFYSDMLKIWSEFGMMASEDSRRKAYSALANSYLDSLIACHTQRDGYWWYMQANRMSGKQEYKKALACYRKALADTTLDKHTLAMMFSSIANINYGLGQKEKGLIAFIRSAIYDNESCTCEITSLYVTAQLIKEFDSKRSSHYLDQAVSMLLAYNGKFRFMGAGGLISETYQDRINVIESRREWLTAAVILTLVVIVLAGVALYVIKRKNKRLGSVKKQLEEKVGQLDKVNTKLAESNAIKDGYIGQIFYENVEFIEKLGHIFNKIGKLLVLKKYDDIGEAVSQKELDKERNGMYHNFDKTFVTLFPNFVMSYNALFEEKDRRHPGKDNILTNEMRIFALMRLGVKESERIARFLGYSVNTVNTYKTRVKNKSIVPNDEFEERIMEIQ